MKIKATRRIQFCAGHRVFKHESKCSNPHGHNYVALFHAEADSLDSIGRVIDFSVLKAKIGSWIDEFWDHTFLVYEKDTDLWDLLNQAPGKNKPLFVCEFNPTAEEMARFLLEKICPDVLEGTGVKVTKVTLWETENCFAEVEL
jgi:6-pyruvoyltetrahydropterin/6-carboxytetrahydropterin synthase